MRADTISQTEASILGAFKDFLDTATFSIQSDTRLSHPTGSRIITKNE